MLLTIASCHLIFKSPATSARELRYTPQVRTSLLQIYQQSRSEELSSYANATVQNYRMGTGWSGRSLGLQRDGEFFLDYTRGNSIEAKQLELRESLRWSHPKWSFGVGLEGSGRLSDGNLNLSLNEQHDRSRSIGVLANLDPINITSRGEVLYEEDLVLSATTQYRMSRMTDWNAGFTQRHRNRRNDFSAPSLSRDNRFQNLFLSLNQRLG